MPVSVQIQNNTSDNNRSVTIRAVVPSETPFSIESDAAGLAGRC